jgi:S-disulfanyl-L-cysteine oxidoreductase SoxD
MKVKIAVTVMCGALLVGGYATSISSSAQQKSQWDGVYTEEQAKRGDELYSKQCAACHGADMAGGEQAPSLTGAEFMTSWDGLSVGDLFERIQLSMPQTNPGSLTGQQNADIIAAILRKGSFPAGTTEIPPQAKAMSGYTLLARKP